MLCILISSTHVVEKTTKVRPWDDFKGLYLPSIYSNETNNDSLLQFNFTLEVSELLNKTNNFQIVETYLISQNHCLHKAQFFSYKDLIIKNQNIKIEISLENIFLLFIDQKPIGNLDLRVLEEKTIEIEKNDFQKIKAMLIKKQEFLEKVLSTELKNKNVNTNVKIKNNLGEEEQQYIEYKENSLKFDPKTMEGSFEGKIKVKTKDR